jgi:hypothetical protein
MANEEDQNPNITDCRGHDIYLPRTMSPHQHAAVGHRNEPRNPPPGVLRDILAKLLKRIA